MVLGLGLGLGFGGDAPGGAAPTPPSAFSFTPVTGATPATGYSETITPSGAVGSWPISCDPGSSYSLDGGASYSDRPGTWVAGTPIKYLVRSSDANGTAFAPSLTIGGVSAAKSVTTTAFSPTVITDALAGAAAQLLTAYSANWTLRTGYTAATGATFNGSGDLYFPDTTAVAYQNTLYTGSATASGWASYSKSVWHKVSTIAAEKIGVVVRGQGAAANDFWAGWDESAGASGRWVIKKTVAGASSTLATAASGVSSFTVGATHTLELYVAGTIGDLDYGVASTAFALWVDGVLVLTWVETTTAYTAVGSTCGVIRSGTTGQSPSTGIHLVSFECGDANPVPSTFSFTPSTSVTPGATLGTQSFTLAGTKSPIVVHIRGAQVVVNGAAATAYASWGFAGQVVSVTPVAPNLSGAQLDVLVFANDVSAAWRIQTSGTASTAKFLYGGNGLVDATSGTSSPSPINAGYDYTINRRQSVAPLVPWSNPVVVVDNWGCPRISTGSAEIDGTDWSLIDMVVWYNGVKYPVNFGGRGIYPINVTASQTLVSDPIPISGTGGEILNWEAYGYAAAGTTPAYPYLNNQTQFNGATGGYEAKARSSNRINLSAMGLNPAAAVSGAFVQEGSNRGPGPDCIVFQGPTTAVWVVAAHSQTWGQQEVSTSSNFAPTDVRLLAGPVQRGLDTVTNGAVGWRNSAVPSGATTQLTGFGSGQGLQRRKQSTDAITAKLGNVPFTHIWTEPGYNGFTGTGMQTAILNLWNLLDGAWPTAPIIASTSWISCSGPFTTNSGQTPGGSPYSWPGPAQTMHDWMAAGVTLTSGKVVRYFDSAMWYSGVGVSSTLLTAAGQTTDPPRQNTFNAEYTDGGALGATTTDGAHPIANLGKLIAKYGIDPAKPTLLAA